MVRSLRRNGETTRQTIILEIVRVLSELNLLSSFCGFQIDTSNWGSKSYGDYFAKVFSVTFSTAKPLADVFQRQSGTTIVKYVHLAIGEKPSKGLTDLP
jgi:hypothetical protein